MARNVIVAKNNVRISVEEGAEALGTPFSPPWVLVVRDGPTGDGWYRGYTDKGLAEWHAKMYRALAVNDPQVLDAIDLVASDGERFWSLIPETFEGRTVRHMLDKMQGD